MRLLLGFGGVDLVAAIGFIRIKALGHTQMWSTRIVSGRKIRRSKEMPAYVYLCLT